MSCKLNFLKTHNHESDGGQPLVTLDAPLQTLHDLFNWPQSFAGPPKKWIPADLMRRSKSEKFQRDVIYCHDMKGGYLDDAHCFGNDNLEAFRFYHWHMISIFQYFSHNFVTIPPVSWIDVAHRNGVRVHGTFLCEHWNKVSNAAFHTIFNSTELSLLAAKKLHAIQHFYKFDGWLIDLMNNVTTESAQEVTNNICLFLKELKSLGSEVIWFDAITSKGECQSQSCLTELNYPFFEASNGIFLKYTWTEKLLESTRKMCGTLQESLRVYIGVDCFGRGLPGGGEWNTHLSLEKILNAPNLEPLPLSIALFAPGWCYEVDSMPGADFFQRNQRFWSLMSAVLPNYGSPTSQTHQDEPNYGIQFETSFCLGLGFHTKRNSTLESVGKWNFLALQQPWPSGLAQLNNEASTYSVLPTLEESFIGGSCLCISLSGASSHIDEKLFQWHRVKLPTSAVLSVKLNLKFIVNREAIIEALQNSLSKCCLIVQVGSQSWLLDVLQDRHFSLNGWWMCQWKKTVSFNSSQGDVPESCSISVQFVTELCIAQPIQINMGYFALKVQKKF